MIKELLLKNVGEVFVDSATQINSDTRLMGAQMLSASQGRTDCWGGKRFWAEGQRRRTGIGGPADAHSHADRRTEAQGSASAGHAEVGPGLREGETRRPGATGRTTGLDTAQAAGVEGGSCVVSVFRPS